MGLCLLHEILIMFPVHTGINRLLFLFIMKSINVPCTHRDKPADTPTENIAAAMFPVHTGINRVAVTCILIRHDVPCTHRDKPA